MIGSVTADRFIETRRSGVDVPTERYAALREYRAHGFQHVEGWCSEALFDIVQTIDAAQYQRGSTGGICEIGVHHGKLFMLMNAVTSPGEASFAIDVFDQQSLNIDYSGSTSEEVFRANLRRYDAKQGQNVTLITGDSTAAETRIEIERLIPKGGIRIFSVDGGHTAEHAVNDLSTANSCVSNTGVVIVDDVSNPHWPGVIEGVVKYLLGTPTLLPFAIGHNKLLLAKLSYHQLFFDAFANSALKYKEVRFMGHRLVAM